MPQRTCSSNCMTQLASTKQSNTQHRLNAVLLLNLQASLLFRQQGRRNMRGTVRPAPLAVQAQGLLFGTYLRTEQQSEHQQAHRLQEVAAEVVEGEGPRR